MFPNIFSRLSIPYNNNKKTLFNSTSKKAILKISSLKKKKKGFSDTFSPLILIFVIVAT